MREMTMENQYSAATLYDGGWRSEDKEDLMAEYEMTEEEAEEICEQLKEIEDAE